MTSPESVTGKQQKLNLVLGIAQRLDMTEKSPCSPGVALDPCRFQTGCLHVEAWPIFTFSQESLNILPHLLSRIMVRTAKTSVLQPAQ
jgi:hypothetical protein